MSCHSLKSNIQGIFFSWVKSKLLQAIKIFPFIASYILLNQYFIWFQYVLHALIRCPFLPEHLLFYLAGMLSHLPSPVWPSEILPIF